MGSEFKVRDLSQTEAAMKREAASGARRGKPQPEEEEQLFLSAPTQQETPSITFSLAAVQRPSALGVKEGVHVGRPAPPIPQGFSWGWSCDLGPSMKTRPCTCSVSHRCCVLVLEREQRLEVVPHSGCPHKPQSPDRFHE